MTTQIRNIGALVAVACAAAPIAVTAGGAGDDTLATGVILDRLAYSTPQSAVLAIPFSATLADAATLSIGYSVETGNTDDLSDAVVLGSATAQVVATGPSGGGDVVSELSVQLSLAGAGRYVRVKFTPDLSAANTDTADLAAVFVFGGSDRLPV